MANRVVAGAQAAGRRLFNPKLRDISAVLLALVLAGFYWLFGKYLDSDDPTFYHIVYPAVVVVLVQGYLWAQNSGIAFGKHQKSGDQVLDGITSSFPGLVNFAALVTGRMETEFMWAIWVITSVVIVFDLIQIGGSSSKVTALTDEHTVQD